MIHFGDKQVSQDTELMEEKKACQHELCVPDGWVDDFDPNKPKKPPAKLYPFALDPFQKVRSCTCPIATSLQVYSTPLYCRSVCRAWRRVTVC